MITRRVTAIVLVAATAASIALFGRLTVDNRLERWCDPSTAEAEVYEAFRGDFGSDEFLLAVIGGGDFFRAQTLDGLLAVAENLETVPGVTRVEGLPILYRDVFGGEDADALEAEMRSPFYRGLFVSADGQEIGLWMQLAPADDVRARATLVHAVRSALRPLTDAGRIVKLVGSPALIVALDEVSQRQARRTLPLALAGSILMLAFMLRSIRAMVAPVVCAAVTVVITLGMAAALGIGINMVTTALPPLLWVLTLAGGIHVVRRYQDLRLDHDETQAITAALAETTRPCALAAVTTAAGFASLMVADLMPVRDLGLLAAVGLLLSLAVNLTLGPVLIGALKVPGKSHQSAAGRGRAWEWGWRRRPRLVVVGGLVVIAAGCAALPLIRTDSNPVDFLPSSHETTRAYRDFGGELGGYYSLEVVVHPPRGWLDPSSWPVLDDLEAHIEASPIVTRVLSPVDILRQLSRWQRGIDAGELPEDARSAAALVARADPATGDLLNSLTRDDGRTVRLSALVNEMEEGRFLRLADDVRTRIDHLPAGWSGQVTGQVLQLVLAQRSLVSTQLKSFSIAFILVFGCMAVGLRSVRLTATAIMPNLVPIFAAFAAMAIAHLALDAATVMVASVALGIAVDNTVHMVENIRRRWVEGLSVAEAAAASLRAIGPAMTATTATSCAGFLALTASDFAPIQSFGLLASVAMVAALAADVFLLPALLIVRDSDR